MIKELSVLSEMVDVAAGEIDRFHYDRAHVILAQVQALAMIEIATSLAKIAGNTGVIYTKDAGEE